MKFIRRSRGAQGASSLAPVQSVKYLGTNLSYRRVGDGPPIVLLHWGIGSTFLWRRVIPYLEDLGTVIALDLPGTGDSGRVSGSDPKTYTIESHERALSGFLELMGANRDLIFVLHGPASMVGFHWAFRHQSATRAIVHMESIPRPTVWPDFDDPFRTDFKRIRFGDVGRRVVNEPAYLTTALRRETVGLSNEDVIREYEDRFPLGPDGRRSYLASYQQIPIAGQPEDAREIVGQYSSWLEGSDVPKLLVLGSPGYILRGRLQSAARRLANQTVVEVIGSHLLPEDAPDGVGKLVRMWIEGLPPV